MRKKTKKNALTTPLIITKNNKQEVFLKLKSFFDTYKEFKVPDILLKFFIENNQDVVNLKHIKNFNLILNWSLKYEIIFFLNNNHFHDDIQKILKYFLYEEFNQIQLKKDFNKSNYVANLTLNSITNEAHPDFKHILDLIKVSMHDDLKNFNDKYYCSDFESLYLLNTDARKRDSLEYDVIIFDNYLINQILNIVANIK